MSHVLTDETESAEMKSRDEKQFFLEVNQLVARKDYDTAITKLLKHLDEMPSSSLAQRALGKIYLFNKQPEKAVKYFELAVKGGANTKQQLGTAILNNEIDSFDDDDFAYVEEQSKSLEESEFSFESHSTDPQFLKANNLDQSLKPLSNKVKTLTLKKRCVKNELDITQTQTTKITYKRSHPLSRSKSSIEPVQNNVITINKHHQEITPSIYIHQDLEKKESSISAELNSLETAIETNTHLDYKSPLSIPETKEQGDLFLDGLDKQYKDDLHNTNYEKLGTKGQHLFEDNKEESDEQDDWHEESEELTTIWDDDIDELDLDDDSIFSDEDDDLEDLDDFDPDAAREDFEEVNLGRVSPFEKAKQIAASVIVETDWDISGLPLLQQIFFENGYSASRKAIIREIENGATLDELTIARELRVFWKGDERFWTAFNHIKLNATGQQARAAYKNLSWAESFRIIRCFGNLPDLEEITEFLNELFEIWYSSIELMRCFKAFFKFLKYRLGHVKSSLPSDIIYFFTEGYEQEIAEDSPEFLSAISPKYQDLLSHGINLYERSYERQLDVQLDEELLSDFLF